MSGQNPGGAPDWPAAPHYPADAFAGTARYYARYRPPYPPALLDDLRRRAVVTGAGRLLDLACGPGRVALPLAPFFGEVWAVDLEPEMIEVGREEAARRGATNVRWTVGRAEDVEAPPGSCEMITIGEAFHRLDQRAITTRALTWLAPGCCLATMGWFGVFA
ncbi:MAG TPA: class I SAM-dependent methyltransferase, partial [Thermomicrobiales bacterium]|nr:class I SAM-dependent methyltransferase [Thermomicrobiales bacterium]